MQDILKGDVMSLGSPFHLPLSPFNCFLPYTINFYHLLYLTKIFTRSYNPCNFSGGFMKNRDQELIGRLLKENEEFKKLYEEHRYFEEKIEELLKRPPSTDIHFEIESLKKQKLAGKDRMELILTKYR